MTEPTWTPPPTNSLTIPGVPTSITRADYLALIETLGLDVKNLVELQFGFNAIYAVVFAQNTNGNRYEDPLERGSLARHRISIPVVDEPEQP